MKSNRDNPMFMPYPNMNGINNPMYPMMPTNDMENKLSSIERQIKRLDARISRLEGSTGMYNNDSNYNTSLDSSYNPTTYPNSMHMM